MLTARLSAGCGPPPHPATAWCDQERGKDVASLNEIRRDTDFFGIETLTVRHDVMAPSYFYLLKEIKKSRDRRKGGEMFLSP